MSEAPDDTKIPISAARAAVLFGVTEKTIHSWVRDGLPVIKAGKNGRGNATVIDLAELITWYLEENALDVAKTRLADAQADKQEMENAARRGELAEVSAVARTWSDLAGEIRAKMLSIPSRLRPKKAATPAVFAARLTEEIHSALRELAPAPPKDARGRARARRVLDV